MVAALQATDEQSLLWEHFLKGDRQAREQLILSYLPLVKYLSERLAIVFKSYYDQEELVSAGIPGLISAVDRYDPGKGVKFETFATIRIRGTIIDWVRSFSWVPRSVYAEARKVSQAMAELEQLLGRAPGDREVADRLHLTLEEYRKLLEKSAPVALVSLDNPLDDGDSLYDRVAGDGTERVLEGIELEETKAALARGIERLPEREQLVVSLYYYDGLTLKEIGRVLGVTESRVAQLHTKALLRLRRFLEEND